MTIQISKLPCGVRVATDEIQTVETVSLGIWVGAGSRNEEESHNGVAHFLEHMAFKGTKNARLLLSPLKLNPLGDI